MPDPSPPASPIVEAVGIALGIDRPTSVDDLATLVVGPQQAFRAQVLLLFVSHAAGLHIDYHTC